MDVWFSDIHCIWSHTKNVLHSIVWFNFSVRFRFDLMRLNNRCQSVWPIQFNLKIDFSLFILSVRLIYWFLIENWIFMNVRFFTFCLLRTFKTVDVWNPDVKFQCFQTCPFFRNCLKLRHFHLNFRHKVTML